MGQEQRIYKLRECAMMRRVMEGDFEDENLTSRRLLKLLIEASTKTPNGFKWLVLNIHLEVGYLD
jgi:hypothetical protein